MHLSHSCQPVVVLTFISLGDFSALLELGVTLSVNTDGGRAQLGLFEAESSSSAVGFDTSVLNCYLALFMAMIITASKISFKGTSLQVQHCSHVAVNCVTFHGTLVVDQKVSSKIYLEGFGIASL